MKRMNMVGSDDKKFYVCVCGYKVNTETFHEKLKENKDNMNKREVERYLRSQKSQATSRFWIFLINSKIPKKRKIIYLFSLHFLLINGILLA